MKSTVRYAIPIVLLVVCVACGGSAPGSPTEVSRALGDFPLPPAPSPPPTNSPPLSGLSRTFFFHSASYPVQGFTKNSRYVLYDNGAFALQYPSEGGLYRGRYSDTNGAIAFYFGIEAVPSATGTLESDVLTVRYSLLMQLSDFEDAVYVLMP